IQLNPDSNYWLDVDAFRGEAGSHGLQEEEALSNLLTWISELSAAVELYRGQFLAGFYVRDAPLFEEWSLIMQESLQRSALNALHRLTEYYQETGAHEQALQLAQRQVELEPYQEVAHQQVMWALALGGQRNEALVHYNQFRELLQTELGVAPLEQTQEMYARLVAGQLPGSPTTDLILRREPRTVGVCPYRGLAAFREVDAPFFYGREEFTERLVETVSGHSTLTVIVGSSGSGKSSAVFAGLLPKLQEDGDWLHMDFRPGRRPFQAIAVAILPHLKPGLSKSEAHLEAQELSEALQGGEISLLDTLQQVLKKDPSASRLLLVVDQFEELYTLCSETASRRRLLDTLLAAIEAGTVRQPSPFILVLTLRADFMGQALAYRPFADTLNECSLILGPMNQAELRTAITNPAEGQGATFEPGLVTRILDDVGQEPGNLPLLEFALTLLWERLDQGWLTHTAYEEIGRVGGALAHYAEDVYLTLEKKQQEYAQQVFVQLVQPGRGTEDIRRLATRPEFGERGWELIQHLTDKRLVVTGQDDEGYETVEIIHEALIREWDRLQGWVDADRAFRVWQEQMRTVLHQWEDSDRDKDALLRGVSLSKAENWLIEKPNDVSAIEHQFIQVSLRARRERQETETIRQERERSLEGRSRNFLRILVMILFLATSVSIGFAMVARKEARQAIEASSLSLAANARQALNDKNATSALVLALVSNRIEEPPQESQHMLLEAAFSPGPRHLFDIIKIFEDIEGPPLNIVINPDGHTALTGFF
ncbi:MAG: AAA family ATPase, partial [Deltaproteobacteria bacterium]|nr:AAA family ATPase [Deltaproteobacteria bacterium]